MKPIDFVFPIDRPDGPFVIQFPHIPDSMDEIKPYAEYVMNCVRTANVQAKLGLDDATLFVMGREFESFLINLWAASRVQGLVNRQLDRPIRRLAEKFADYVAIAEGHING